MLGVPKEVLVDGVRFEVRRVEVNKSGDFVWLDLQLVAKVSDIAKAKSEFVSSLSKPKRKFNLDDDER